jgi:hypothetical protein
MPVLWTVSHATRSVVISATGVVRLADMEECVRAIVTPATLSYRKLLDFSHARLVPSREGIEALSTYVREHRGTGTMGALAIVVGSDEVEHQARLFKSMEVADRAMEIFREPGIARVWLDAQPSPALPAWLDDAQSAGLPQGPN